MSQKPSSKQLNDLQQGRIIVQCKIGRNRYETADSSLNCQSSDCAIQADQKETINLGEPGLTIHKLKAAKKNRRKEFSLKICRCGSIA